MGLFSGRQTVTAEPGPLPYFEPLPEGYKWARMSDAPLPLVCQKCGAAVIWESGVELHSAWHARND